MGDHEFLKFPKNIPWNVYNSKINNISRREIVVPRALYWGTLASLGIDHKIFYYLTKSLVYEDDD